MYKKLIPVHFTERVLRDVKYTVSKKRKIEYLNLAASFDTENTSFYYQGEKASVVYLWASAIGDMVFYGRTWDEFIQYIEALRNVFHLDTNKRHLIMYVHNLSHDFSFMGKLFQWENVFALEERKVVQAVTQYGIEFRCSYILSGFNLENIAKNLKWHTMRKAVGDLDYDLMRHTETYMTQKEMEYVYWDVRIVTAYIEECMRDEGDNITRIPLTKTGYVRRACRDACLYGGQKGHNSKEVQGKFGKYHRFMLQNTLTVEQYLMAHSAFQGGFVHSNMFQTRKTIEGVQSVDLASSYPTIMVAEKFPMGKGEEVFPETLRLFKRYCNAYWCLCHVTFHNLRQKVFADCPISYSRCEKVPEGKKLSLANGRIMQAEEITMTITSTDFQIIDMYYEYDEIEVGKMYVWSMDYLPTDLVEQILVWYESKTKLKGVQGMDEEYAGAKANLNSIYGMMVTNIIHDEIIFDNESDNGEYWSTKTADPVEQIEQYNRNPQRFTSYLWGVAVTAYGRYNVLSTIAKIGDRDYIYSDTDSIKFRNPEEHAETIADYNRTITEKLNKACEHHGIDPERTRPYTIEGKQKQLGVFDYEEKTTFKTLGAKRYLCQDGNHWKLTVAGLGKSAGMDYLLSEAERQGCTPFDLFNESLQVPAENTGKMTHTYIDTPRHGVMTDYHGRKAEFHELTGVHLENAPYDMSIAPEYKQLLDDILYERMK